MIERVDQRRCDGCNLCVAVCPCDVFRPGPKGGPVRIAYRDDCQTCFACELDCPEGAISVSPMRRPRVQPW